MWSYREKCRWDFHFHCVHETKQYNIYLWLTHWELLVILKVRRVQKYVETLDILKIKNQNQTQMQIQQRNSDAPPQAQVRDHQDQKSNGHDRQGSTGQLSSVPEIKPTPETVVTTRWEIFDAMPPLVPTPSSTTIPAKGSNNNNNHVQPKFNWEFFDWKNFIRSLLCVLLLLSDVWLSFITSVGLIFFSSSILLCT